MGVEVLAQPIVVLLSIISGIAVGFSLGLIGGGGSILAVPLLLYVVGLEDTHAAIGTSAFAVGVIAAINLVNHKKQGNVVIKKGILFAIPGIGGSIIGAQLGLLTPPDELLILFATLMALIGVLMLKKRSNKKTNSSFRLARNLPLSGFAVGVLAGYFGIGGGFLIVPTLMYSGTLSITQAIGTSLVAVSSFGFATSARYFVADQIDFTISALFVIGGILGGYLGTHTSKRILKERLTKIFAFLLFVIAAYIILRTVIN